MSDRLKSLFFDFIQFGSLLFLVFTGPLLTANLLNTFLQVIALLLIISAVWEMRRNKFYRVPDVGKQDRLISSGIYQYIRHPMYTSQILFATTLLGNYFSFARLGVFIILLSNFILKIQYEEKLLQKHFPNYQEYKKRSFKLVPFL